MNDTARLYMQEWTKFALLRKKYRYFMIDHSSHEPTVRLRDPEVGNLLDLRLDKEYAICISRNFPQTSIIDAKCNICCMTVPKTGFIGQLNFTCEKCVWIVFQDPNKTLTQRIRNLFMYNEECVKWITEPDKKVQFYKMWYQRLMYTLNKLDFYTQNVFAHRRNQPHLSNDYFNLPNFVVD